MSIAIAADRCVRCHKCLAVCAPRVYVAAADGAVSPDYAAKCNHCGQCAAVCPAGAITVDGINPDTLAPVTPAPLTETQRDMLFRARRSVRLFKPEPVDETLLTRALHLAANAPTARNAREICWTILNGRDKLLPLAREAAEALAASGLPQYAHHAKGVQTGRDTILRGAPCLLVAHAKPWRWAEADCACAVSYLELALHSLGIGSCWAGAFVNATHVHPLPSLPLPEGHTAFAGLMAGTPAIQYARVPGRAFTSITRL